MIVTTSYPSRSFGWVLQPHPIADFVDFLRVVVA